MGAGTYVGLQSEHIMRVWFLRLRTVAIASRWCSRLSHQSNTLKVTSSILV